MDLPARTAVQNTMISFLAQELCVREILLRTNYPSRGFQRLLPSSGTVTCLAILNVIELRCWKSKAIRPTRKTQARLALFRAAHFTYLWVAGAPAVPVLILPLTPFLLSCFLMSLRFH